MDYSSNYRKPAHAREPWTAESVEKLWKDNGGWILTSNPYSAIADAHNATLQRESRAAHASEDTRRLDWIKANHHRFVTGNLPVTRKGIDAKMNKENAAHASEDAFVGECATGANPVWKAAHASEALPLQHDDRAAAIVRREDLIDEIVGDLVRETNIFPNQVERAKELIRERLNEKGIKETCQREP